MYMYIHVEPRINMAAGIIIVDHLLVAFYMYMYTILYMYVRILIDKLTSCSKFGQIANCDLIKHMKNI